jgi:hypothetical protein
LDCLSALRWSPAPILSRQSPAIDLGAPASRCGDFIPTDTESEVDAYSLAVDFRTLLQGTFDSDDCWTLHLVLDTVAVAHSILVTAWHLRRDGTPYHERGADCFDHHDRAYLERVLVKRLDQLANKLLLQPLVAYAILFSRKKSDL